MDYMGVPQKSHQRFNKPQNPDRDFQSGAFLRAGRILAYIDLITKLMDISDEEFNKSIPFDPKNVYQLKARQEAEKIDKQVLKVIEAYEDGQ